MELIIRRVIENEIYTSCKTIPFGESCISDSMGDAVFSSLVGVVRSCTLWLGIAVRLDRGFCCMADAGCLSFTVYYT